MKKYLFMLFFLPCLLYTQRVFGQNKPDSVYVYSGEERQLIKVSAIMYDDDNRILREEGRIDLNGDGLIQANEMYKMSYVYTETGGLFTIEAVKEIFEDEQWINSSKEVKTYKASNLNVPVHDCAYSYDITEGKWDLYSKTIATEYNEKGFPVVLMDTLPYPTMLGLKYALKSKVLSYNESNLLDAVLYASKKDADDPSEEFTPSQKDEFMYDDNHVLIQKRVYSYDNLYNNGNPIWDWSLSNTIDYEYDEYGNIIREGDVYYTNIYSSANSNDFIADIAKNPQLFFADGQVEVVFDDDMLFDVAIYNMQGLLMTQQKNNRNHAAVSFNKALPGIYIVHVISGEYRYTQKIVKN